MKNNKEGSPFEPKTVNWVKWLFIGIAILVIIGAAYLGMKSIATPTVSELPITTYQNVFIDMNGDGKLDFVKYAEVVLNQEPTPAPNP